MPNPPWEMGLESGPFERVRSGRKLVEFRLNQPKWKNMAVGDTIVFSKEPDRTETTTVEVLELMRYPTFQELLEYCEQQGCLEQVRTVSEQVQRLGKRYPAREREKHAGVLGIKIKVIKDG